MTELTLYGRPENTFVRTARMVCEEKDAPYTLEEIGPDEIRGRGLDPFGGMPVLRHGTTMLRGALAVSHYIEATFGGPALEPSDKVERASMLQWIGICTDHLHRDVVAGWILAGTRGEADAADARRARETVFHHLGELNQALAEGPYLVGGRISLADLWLAPILDRLARTPDGEELMRKFARVGLALRTASQRPSFRRTAP